MIISATCRGFFDVLRNRVAQKRAVMYSQTSAAGRVISSVSVALAISAVSSEPTIR